MRNSGAHLSPAVFGPVANRLAGAVCYAISAELGPYATCYFLAPFVLGRVRQRLDLANHLPLSIFEQASVLARDIRNDVIGELRRTGMNEHLIERLTAEIEQSLRETFPEAVEDVVDHPDLLGAGRRDPTV